MHVSVECRLSPQAVVSPGEHTENFILRSLYEGGSEQYGDEKGGPVSRYGCGPMTYATRKKG